VSPIGTGHGDLFREIVVIPCTRCVESAVEKGEDVVQVGIVHANGNLQNRA
jgi:hypothetical protein